MEYDKSARSGRDDGQPLIFLEDPSSKPATVPLRRSGFVQYAQHMAAHESAHLKLEWVCGLPARHEYWRHLAIHRRVRLKADRPKKPVVLSRSNHELEEETPGTEFRRRNDLALRD